MPHRDRPVKEREVHFVHPVGNSRDVRWMDVTFAPKGSGCGLLRERPHGRLWERPIGSALG